MVGLSGGRAVQVAPSDGAQGSVAPPVAYQLTHPGRLKSPQSQEDRRPTTAQLPRIHQQCRGRTLGRQFDQVTPGDEHITIIAGGMGKAAFVFSVGSGSAASSRGPDDLIAALGPVPTPIGRRTPARALPA